MASIFKDPNSMDSGLNYKGTVSEADKKQYARQGESSYSFYDESGKNIGGMNVSNAVNPSSITTVYKDKEGNLSLTKPETETSISINPKTGKILVKAPQQVLESDWFKKQFKNSDVFKEVAKEAKRNPNGSTSVSYLDKNGDVVEKKVSDWVKDESEALKEYASDYINKIIPIREEVKKSTKGGITLSDTQVVISQSGLNRNEYRNDSKTAVYLPDGILRLGDFESMGSWDADTKTISAKDFYDWYNLHDDKGKDIIEMEKVLNWQLDYFLNTEEPGEADAEQLARTLSFYKTLKADDPEADFFEGFGLFLQSFEQGFKKSLVDASINLYSFAEDALTKIAEVTSLNTESGKIIGALSLGSTALVGAAASVSVVAMEAEKAIATDFGEFIAGIDNSPTEQNAVNSFVAIGDLTKGLLDGKGKDSLVHWSEQTGTPLSQDALKVVDEIYDKKLGSLAEISGAANAGRVIGNFAGEVVKQIALTNVVGGVVGGAVKGFVGAAGAKTYSLFNFGNDVDGFIKALSIGVDRYTKIASLSEKTYAFASATEVVAGALGMGANLLSQGLVDTVLNDEQVVKEMLENPNDETRDAAFNAVFKNSMLNVFGELTGLGIGLGGKAKRSAAEWIVENTKTGAAVDAATKRAANLIAGKKHLALQSLADWMAEGNGKAAKFFDKLFKASDPASRWYAALHWEEAQAALKVASAAEGVDISEAATKETAEGVLNKMELEVALNKVTRGTMREWSALTKNPAIAKQYADFSSAISKAVAAEGANAVEIAGMKYLSQETSNYIAKSLIIDKLADKEAVRGSLSAIESSYKTALEERVAKYISSHSEEVKAAADNVIAKERLYEKSYMDLAVAKVGDDGGLGLYDADTVKGWRDTKYWGEEGEKYVPLIAIKNGEDAISAARRAASEWESAGNYKAKLSVDEYEAKPGDADANYLDPTLTIFAQQVTAAKVMISRDWGDVLLKIDPLAKEINTEGMPVVKSDITKARKQIHSVVDNVFNDIRAQDTIWEYNFSNTFKRSVAGAEEKAGKKVLRTLGLSDPKQFKRAAYSLGEEDIVNLGKRGYKIPEIAKFRNVYQLQTFYDSLSSVDKKIVDNALGTEPFTVKNFNNALDSSDMRIKLQRSYVAKNIAESNNTVKYNDYIIRMKEKLLDAEAKTKLATAYANYADAIEQTGLKKVGLDDFSKLVNGFVEDNINIATETLKDNSFLAQMLKRYSEEGVPEDVAKRYLVLQEYRNYFAKNQSKKAFREMIDKNLSSLNVSGNLTTKSKLSLVNAIRDGVEEQIDSEWAKAANAVKSAGGAGLLDTEDMFNYIYKQMSDFIDTTVKNPNVIQVLDGSGKFHLYEVDPATATLYNTRPDFSSYKKKGLSSFFNKTNRLARMGNVGFSLKSFMNQWLRDPLNAYVMGGMVRTVGKNGAYMGELLGPQVVEMMKEAMGAAGWKDFTAEIAENLGREATQEELQAAAKEALSKDALEDMASLALGDIGIETQYYREMATGYKDQMWSRFQEEASAAQKALDSLEKHSLGNFRETYLRKGVYAQSFNDAIASGKTIKEAKTIAEFTMLNATTNFSRAFAWGNNLTTSVSFLGAAINGKASFWRLLEVDPIGVSTRFISGLVIPTMALVSQSLQSEADREIYENIPEYEKEDNIVFVVDGTKMKIPVPQELSAFIAPFRQLVEKSYDANRHAWGELIMSDILGTSSIDLSGVMALDENTLMGDLTLADRLSSEARTLISQLSPTVVKTAYMLITGVDPYTGNQIDASKVYVDEDGIEIIDNKTNAFTTWLADTLKNLGVRNAQGVALSGSSVHALLQTLLGNGGSDVLDMITDLFNGEPQSLLTTPAESAIGAFQSKSSTDAAQYAWSDMVKQLSNEKDAIMNSDEYQSIAKALSMLDPSDKNYDKKRQNYLRQYHELVQDFQQKVYNSVKRAQSVYGSDYDRKRFAATINLLTFSENFGTSINEVEREANKTLYYEARSRALQTMASYGFDSPTDLSIFGYMATDEYGNAQMKQYSPVAIMNMQSEVWGQSDIDTANMESILKSNNLTSKYMYGDEYKKAKKAGKTALKQYKAQWNTKVVKALAPYVKSRGVTSVLENFATRDMLDNIIFVNNPYKTKDYLTKIFGGK